MCMLKDLIANSRLVFLCTERDTQPNVPAWLYEHVDSTGG